MNPIALLLGLLCAAGIIVFFWSLDKPKTEPGDDLDERLRGYGGEVQQTLEEIELQLPFKQRVVDPVIERVGRLVSSRTPESARQAVQAKLQLAGRPAGLTPSNFQLIRYLAALAFFVIGLALGILSGKPIFAAIGAAVGCGLGYYLPLIWLNQKAAKRREEIGLALPDAMDLLTVAVEAGLGFDAAVSRVTSKFTNALSEEFAQVLQETKLGRPRLEALEDMGFRCGVESLHNFIQAIVQSEQMGVGIAKILRLQSEEIRRKRRQRAQEQAAQATLKMMLPMVGCIFPTLWIILLGPAIILVLSMQHAS